MDYRSPLQDSYDSHDRQQSSYGGRYAPYPQRRGHADYRQIQPHPYSADQSSSMAVTKYSNRYKPTSYPKELTAQFGAHNCMLCGLELQSPIVAKMHYSGKQHIKKVKNYLINWSSKTGLPMPEINESLNVNGSALANYCELCDVKMTSINDKILHYSGKNHQKNERDPANAKKKKKAYETVDISGRFGIGESFSAEIPAIEGSKEVDLASQAFYCKLCEVSAVSQDQLNQHISGKKHKEKLEKTYSVDIAKKDKPFKCNICSVSLTTHDLFTLHLQGKRHKKNVSKLETSETGEGAVGPSSSTSNMPIPVQTGAVGRSSSTSNMPIPVQIGAVGPSSSTSNTPMHVETGGLCLKPSTFPKVLADMFCAKECKLCESQIQIPIMAKQHYSAKHHMEKVTKYMVEWSKKTGLRLEMLKPEDLNGIPLKDYCDICQITFDTLMEKYAHHIGTNHLAALNPKEIMAIKESSSSETIAIKKEETQFDRHLQAGMKQEEKMKSKPAGFSPKVKNKPYDCNICDVSLETMDLLQSHLLGEEHNKNILKMKMGDTEKDIKENMKCEFCYFVGNTENHICENKIKNIEEKWVCTFCNGMVFDTEQEYNEHKNSDQHVLGILNSEGDVVVEELRHWFCILCKKQSHTYKEYTDHLFEEKHMVLSQAHPMLESNNCLFECTVCNITLTQELKEQHLLDKQHIIESIRKDTIKTLADLANKDISTINFNCENCKTGPLNFVQYSEHILGYNHMQVMIHLHLSQIKSSASSSCN